MKRKFKIFTALIMVSMVGSSVVSCTPSPEWVKSQRDKVKATLIKPTANESKHGNVNEFTVFISVTADSMLSGGGIPIFHSGGGNLGAKFQIIRPGVRYEHASSNVDDCIDKAAEQGVIQSFSSEQSGQDGFYTTHQSQSIEPFVNRFTDCLKDFGYLIR